MKSGSVSGPGLGPPVQEASPELHGRQLLLPVSLQRPELPERPRSEGEEEIGPRLLAVGGRVGRSGGRGGRGGLGQWWFPGGLRTLELDVAEFFEPQR